MEIAYGNISPQGDDTKERKKFIAFMFMDGADKKQYGYLMKSLETDHSLGKTDVYPDGIESALQVLILYSEKALKKKKKKNSNISMVQAGPCWECGSKDHIRKDCPKYKAKLEKKEMSYASLLQAKLELERELARREDDGHDSDESSVFWGAIAVFEDQVPIA